jgi:hypothetical protein
MSQTVEIMGGSLTENVVIDKRFIATSNLERNISTQSAEYVRYNPIGNVNNTQIEFQIEPSEAGYIDLKNSYIVSQVRILKNGSTPTVAADLLSLKAYTSLLQWSDIQTTVNGVNLSDENSNEYPYSAWVKTALTESNLAPATLTIVPGATTNVACLSSSDSREVEGILYPNNQGLCGIVNNSMTSAYQIAKYYAATGSGGYVSIVTRPKEGIWQQPDYLQPNLRLRVVLTKNTNNDVIQDVATVATFNTLDYQNVVLYVKRVYPTPSMQSIARASQMENGMLYTLLRARTATVQFQRSQTSLTATGLLAGQNPSLVVVGFYSVLTPTGQVLTHRFNSDIQIQSLYIRSGGARYPANYDYERLDPATAQDSPVDYNEYVLACKASSHNSTMSDNENPLLSLEAYSNMSFFVFNTKQNQETMFGRDDSSNSKGSVDVYARFNAGSSGNANCVVIGLGHDKVHVSHDGKVVRLGW